MTRAEQRQYKREIKNEIAQFFKIQNHYFPDLIEDIRKVLDGRNTSYTTYEIEVILGTSAKKFSYSIPLNDYFRSVIKQFYRINL